MQRRYTCVCCGWIGCEKTDPIRCPDCGGITQRVITNWDGVQSDLLKLGGVLLSFVSMAYVWTLLTYPFTFGYQPIHKVELQISAAGLIDTPNGPVSQLSRFAAIVSKSSVRTVSYGGRLKTCRCDESPAGGRHFLLATG